MHQNRDLLSQVINDVTLLLGVKEKSFGTTSMAN